MSAERLVPPEIDQRLCSILTDGGFPEWAEYLSGRNGVIDPLSWLEKRDPAKHGEVVAGMLERYKRPFVTLSTTTTQSAAVLLYLEACAGECVAASDGGLRDVADERIQDIVSGFGPIPIGVTGHIMVFAHFDPSVPAPSALPRTLSSVVWVSVDEYLQLRDDFRFRAQSLATALAPKTLKAVEPPPKSSGLRGLLQWVANVPTVEVNERQAIEFLLALPDSELTQQRLPGDLLCSLRMIEQPDDSLIPASALKIDPKTIARVTNRGRCTELGWVPYASNSKTVFIAAERDSRMLADVVANYFPGLRPRVYLASADSVRYLLSETNRSTTKPIATIGGEDSTAGVLYRPDPAKYGQKAPRLFLSEVDQLIEYLLCDATSERASDIHIDIFAGLSRIRYVIDGVAATMHNLPTEAALKIANKLRDAVCKHSSVSQSPTAPQEGAFSYAFLGKRIMCRVTIAFDNGESKRPKIVLRILDTSAGVRDLSLIGLYPDEQTTIRKHLRRKHGLVLVCGPTGSGKSTTLMACIQEINTPSNIIYTLEDPPEYRIPGVAQLPVASKEEEKSSERLSFEDGMRLLMRMDPDVIMVGEIRDLATAAAAVSAANTGHLLLATVHANSAPDSVSRVVSMGIDRAQFAENCRLVVSQRLVRALCGCRLQVPISEKLSTLFKEKGIKPLKWVCEPAPKGCPRCRGTGYNGRLVILEMLEITSGLSDLITDGAPASAIRKAAQQASTFVSLFKAGLRRVASGQTSYSALLDVIDEE